MTLSRYFHITFLLAFLIPFCTGYGQNFVVTKDTKSNCETWGVEDHTHPIIGISITFPRGASLDTPEQMGLSSFMVGMLGQGTEKFNHITFSEFLEDHALKFSSSLDDDTLTVAVAFPSQFLDDALQALHQVLAKATFPTDRLEEMRKRTVESLPALRESPDYLAMLIRHTVSCGGKRCLQDTSGTSDSLNRITREDLLMRYHQTPHPGRA